MASIFDLAGQDPYGLLQGPVSAAGGGGFTLPMYGPPVATSPYMMNDPRSLLGASAPVAMGAAPKPRPVQSVYDDAVMRRARNPVMAASAPAQQPMPIAMPMPKPQRQTPAPTYDDAVMRRARTPMPAAAPAPQASASPAAPAASQSLADRFSGLLGSDFNDPRTQGLLGASAALLEAGGPQVGAPVGLGQALGRALTAGTTAYGKAQDAAMAREDAEVNRQYKLAQAKQMENAATRPILTDLGNGAYTRVTDPVTGESKIVENDEVKEYLERQATIKQTKNINLSDKQIEAQTEELDNIASTNDLLGQTDGFLDMIEDGELEFGFIDSVGDSLSLVTGIGDTQEAMNSQSFDRYINRLRNELLRMARGVQTDADAERVIAELVTGVESKNTGAVKNALIELRDVQNKTIRRLRAKVQNRRKAKGLDNYDFNNEATADGVGYSVVEDDD